MLQVSARSGAGIDTWLDWVRGELAGVRAVSRRATDKRSGETGMSTAAGERLQALHALNIEKPVRIMNVCGGHERSISVAGLRGDTSRKRRAGTGSGMPRLHLS